MQTQQWILLQILSSMVLELQIKFSLVNQDEAVTSGLGEWVLFSVNASNQKRPEDFSLCREILFTRVYWNILVEN